MSKLNEEPTMESLKEKGNAAVKEKKFEEALLHYTHAIKIDRSNHTLYSNRSLAFLKIQQYSLALDDAIETIRLAPTWPKGYFRRAEIEYETCRYREAVESYELALKFKPDDAFVMEALLRTKRALVKDVKADEQIPWVGAGIGIVFGVTIVIADYLLTVNPTHPLVMAFFTMAIAIMGWGIGKGYRHYVKSQRSVLYEMSNVSDDVEEETKENGKTKPRPRYTKSQARQRYKAEKL